ncbi:protein lin-28 homolog B [Eucyclogobius newberryi]|uniref:protein lin-28 homolog B n=1 Tax=Eucyclogobius newberryi TaxID=166745 RepID=UPI003B5958EA
MAEGGTGKGGRGAEDRGAKSGGRGEQHEERGRAAAAAPHQVLAGTGFCKWFNVRMGFGFISMTSSEGSPVDPPMDVFVHQSKLVMEGFRSLKEGEPLEFSYKKSSKGLESLRVTGPGGGPCSGSERRPKGKMPVHKRKPKGDRCYNCGGLDHHAKECGLPPQPKKCHYCQSITHMVAQCPHKALAPLSGSQDPQHASTSASSSGTGSGHYLCAPEEEEGGRGGSGSSPLEGSSSSPEETHSLRAPRSQRWRKS